MRVRVRAVVRGVLGRGAMTAVATRARSAPVRRWVALAGPGALVAIGYVDPGNWATDLTAGSRYAHALLWVVVAASLLGMLFQTLSARLGIATGRDLASLTREAAPRAAWPLWAAAELAIIATDLAEVLGSAIALELLFAIPLALGVALTALDVVVLLALERRGSQSIEVAGLLLAAIVGSGLLYELFASRPDLASVARGFVPHPSTIHGREMLVAIVGILGATVMPHNLYLHSHLAARDMPTPRGATKTTIASLGIAMFFNAALVVVAGSAFHALGRDVSDLRDAHHLLAPALGSTLAPTLFAFALLAAGQSATLTGTLAGQIVMNGMVDVRLPAWQRRLFTRACAIVPAAIVVAVSGESSAGMLLVVSQVVLSLALPLSLVPLVLLTSSKARMGTLVSGPILRVSAWTGIVVVVAANALLVVEAIR